jgi:hypothetical protein
MVLPAPVASTVRAAGGIGGRGVAINIGTVHVKGGRDGAREFFAELEKCVEKSMRFGTLQRVVLDQVKPR